MASTFALPPPKSAPGAPLGARLGAFLFKSWKGRLLLASLALVALDQAGVSTSLLGFLAYLYLWVFCFVMAFRGARWVVREFLWRIRTKLIVSYLFIAVVPLVLLLAFFAVGGILALGLVAANMVTTEVGRIGDELRDVSHAALVSLPADDAAAAAALEPRLVTAKALHPELSWVLVRKGRVVARHGAAIPEALPGWWTGPGFGGLVSDHAEAPEKANPDPDFDVNIDDEDSDKPGRNAKNEKEAGEAGKPASVGSEAKKDDGEADVMRGVWSEGDGLLILQAPVDETLFAQLEKRTGVLTITAGGELGSTSNGGMRLNVRRGEVHRVAKQREIKGMAFIAPVERTHWPTGKRSLNPIIVSYQPVDFVQRLRSVNKADLLVKLALAVTGGVFLVMYFVALLLGLFLARSITRSVHELSLGTERLRQGDFRTPIPVTSRDQLGELAESFNVMSRGIENLLLERTEKERLEEELRIARKIQMSLLPQGEVEMPGLRVAALCLPAAEVGGDYYDLLPLGPDRMGVLVADVSGKGTSAALYMAELKGLVLSLSRIYDSPARLLSEANRILATTIDPRSFITMTYAVVDLSKRTMRYARAGHNPVIYQPAGSGATQVLTPPGMGLGMDRGERFDQVLEEAELALQPDDVLLFFTDGLSEAMNPSAELFGETRLRAVLESSDTLGTEEIKQRILEEIRVFVGGAAQHDDMTMVILKVV